MFMKTLVWTRPVVLRAHVFSLPFCACQEHPPEGGKSCRRGFMGYLIIMSQAIVEASRQSIIGPDGTPLVEDEEDLEDGSGEVSAGCSFQLFMLRELEPSLAERWAEVSQSADTSTRAEAARDVFCVFVCLSICAVHAG